mgnify:CR=1 FL=1
MNRLIGLLMLTLMLTLRADAAEDKTKELATELQEAVRLRDFVRFTHCFANKTELLTFVRRHRNANATMAQLNGKFTGRPKRIMDSYNAIIEAMADKRVEAVSLKATAVRPHGHNREEQMINMLAVTLTDNAGKKVVVEGHDLILTTEGWRIAGDVSIETD